MIFMQQGAYIFVSLVVLPHHVSGGRAALSGFLFFSLFSFSLSFQFLPLHTVNSHESHQKLIINLQHWKMKENEQATDLINWG